MNTLLRVIVLAGLLGVATMRAAESAVPELRGMLATGADRRFALSVPGDNQTAWVAVGDNFAGWKLSAYRASEDTLVLNKDGKEVLLKLSASKIAVADTKATLADAEAVLNKMKFEDMFGKMLEQQKRSMVGMMKKMTGDMKGVNPEDFAAYQSKVMDTMYATMKPEEMKADFARIYSDVFTKEELQGLADFYGTPAGVAMIDKQPEVQQKTMEIMMPRMMAIMPKIQQLSAEFAKEQAAKKAAAAAPATP
ncbi:MAG TPA: DUF2059 domain-containing protein [Rariglobus sp.]|nr:DUF2059 domain-containing protein [Rariglobus sp.]